MTRVVIVHGCPSDEEKGMSSETRTYDKHWIPWIKEKLISNGIEVETPLMPDPWEPSYEKFKGAFDSFEVDEDSVLIGHSCGSAFLVRWLGDTKKNVSKLILVAPWKIPDQDDNFRKSFYGYSIDQTIKNRVGNIVIFTSDNEEEEGKESARIFHGALGGEVVNLPGRGHYTQGDMGTTQFPELLEVILK